jgi:Ca-activated chloride channel family protein
MRYAGFGAPTVAILLFSCLQYNAAFAGNSIKLSVEPSQSVLAAGEPNKAYVRVQLEGLPDEEPAARPPVNVALVIDRSGSMRGPKIEQAKEAAILALSRLSPRDRVSVAAFDHNVDVVVPAGPFVDFSEMRRRIASIEPGGRTAIYAAVRQAGQSVSEAVSEGRVSRVILMSDGQANVGPSSPADLEHLGRELDDEAGACQRRQPRFRREPRATRRYFQ